VPATEFACLKVNTRPAAFWLVWMSILQPISCLFLLTLKEGKVSREKEIAEQGAVCVVQRALPPGGTQAVLGFRMCLNML
jgi:hypothetical protein